MATVSGESKVAYIYDQATDTWHPVAGIANTSADYDWGGSHVFNTGNTVTMDAVFDAKAGVNNYQNPNLRDLALPNPISGITAFIRQDNVGNTINQLQFYSNGQWNSINAANFLSKSTSFSLISDMIGSTIKISVSNPNTVTVTIPASEAWPIGSKIEFLQIGDGTVRFIPESTTPTLNSKYGDRTLAASYAAAVLVKTANGEWTLIGDLWTP